MRVFFTLFVFILLFVLTETVKPAAGNIDAAFGNNGKIRTSISSGGDYANATAIQPDGKILVAGNVKFNLADFAVVRYNPNGTLDTTFGTNGVFTTPMGGGIDKPYAVLLQNDGKIILVGGANSGMVYNPALVRLNGNGTIDTTFGANGKVITVSHASEDNFYTAKLQPDGKIVVGGGIKIGTARNDFAVLRYNTDGTLDTSFDGDGIVSTIMSTGYDTAKSVSLQNDGKILLSGQSWNGSNSDIAVVRYNSDGSQDNSFGSGGIALTSISSTTIEEAYDSVIQPDGKIIVVGRGDGVFITVRYNIDGSRDATFGNNGIVSTAATAFGRAVVLQPDGKILVGGDYETPAVNRLFTIVRYHPNGNVDTAFGNMGKVYTDITGRIDIIYALALQTDGRIIAVGSSGQGDSGIITAFTTVRYNANGSPFADFDGDGKTDISIFRPTPGEWWYLRSSDGGNRAFQFGTSSDKIVPSDYTGDGKSDIAFWRPSTGQWYILRSEDFSFYAFPFGTVTDTPVPADYDGDGKTDAAVFRVSNNTWYINKSSGGTDITTFGISGDKPVPADYDGDGKADIAIYRDNNGVSEWWIRRSSNASVFAAQFGNWTDRAVQGDYTGDGKADVAVWRPSNGNWYILRSENFSFYSFPFGGGIDTPVPADYDGDGKFDAGIFRGSNNTWYIQRSTAGTLIQSFGINGDLAVPNTFVP